MQALVNDLRAACDEVVHGAARAKREVEAARQVSLATVGWVRLPCSGALHC